MDDYDRRVVVMQPTDDYERREERYLLEFDFFGQAELLATIPAQKYHILDFVKDSFFPLPKFRMDF